MDIKELDALLASASAPTADASICLRGDLRAKWESLNTELEQAESRESLKLTGTPSEAKALREELDALEDEMRDSTLTLTFQGIGRKAWRELEAKHSPREGDEVDRFYGFNSDTLFDEAIPACLKAPEIEAAKFLELLGKLTAAQYEKLAVTVLNLNRQDVDVPLSRRASRSTKASGKTSKQRRA